MEAFSLYLLKSVIWLCGFAIVFILFLRNERFFLLNRIYLIAGIFTSFLFPFISVHYTVVLPVVRSIQTQDSVVSGIQNSAEGTFPVLELTLLAIYLLGVLFVLAMIIRQSRLVINAIRNGEIISFQPVKLIRTADYPAAFSFFSYVFVNPSVTDLETKEIVNHELVHIRQKHWFDLMLVELLCLMQWFNPLTWIYIRLIRQNHEYLADEVALQRTTDPSIYRATLLNQIVGSPVVTLTNSFNYSLNKKRFNMMKNIISSPYRKFKIFLILPVFAIVLYSFAKPDYKYIYTERSSGNEVPALTTQIKEVKGIVVAQDEPLPGANITVRGTTIGTSTDAKGRFKLENIPDEAALVVSFVGYKSKVVKPVFDKEMRIKMVSDTIKTGKVTMSPPPPPPPPASGESNIGISMALPPPPPPPSGSSVAADGTAPLYVVDGFIVTQAEAEKLDPNSIESVNVFKNKSRTDKYGEKGKDGVVEITTKEKAAKMLVIIDGVVHEKDGMSKINVDDIESMNVLKEQTAIDKYGEKGKNGAIEVTTFKAGEKRPDGTIVTLNPGDPKTGKEPFVVVEEKPEIPGGKEPFVVVEEMPEFPGGKEAMREWISSNIIYPADAVKAKVTGTVYIDFLVGSNGKVKNVTVSNPVFPALDAEAIRVVSSMPNWKPGIQNGKSVNVRYRVPVEFKLP